jgi:hypothetical protein
LGLLPHQHFGDQNLQWPSWRPTSARVVPLVSRGVRRRDRLREWKLDHLLHRSHRWDPEFTWIYYIVRSSEI